MCAQSCPSLFDPIDNSPPDSSVHGIFQARILEWVAIPFSRGSSRPHDHTHVSGLFCSGRQTLFHCATWEPKCVTKVKKWGKLCAASQVSHPVCVTFPLPPMLFCLSCLVNCSFWKQAASFGKFPLSPSGRLFVAHSLQFYLDSAHHVALKLSVYKPVSLSDCDFWFCIPSTTTFQP